MKDDILDAVGKISWYMVFVAPILSVLFIWRFYKINKLLRIIIGIIIGLSISSICYIVALKIIFRDGMGPG